MNRNQDSSARFVSRAGLKLEHALDAFELDVNGLICADFGCNVGGFTDCLLQRGAGRVYAIDTGYGVLDYRLRQDPRVITMERTNALHADPPHQDRTARREGFSGCDLVTIDLAWTLQRHAIPAALRWLRRARQSRPTFRDGGRCARIIALIKPHYELDEAEKRTLIRDGRLDPAEAQRVTAQVLDTMPELGAQPLALTLSPITGGKSGRKRRKGSGNVEYLALLSPRDDTTTQA